MFDIVPNFFAEIFKFLNKYNSKYEYNSDITLKEIIHNFNFVIKIKNNFLLCFKKEILIYSNLTLIA